MEACHYSYCLSTCFMQNYIISDCYIRSLEYPNTQLEIRKCVMEVIKHRFLIKAMMTHYNSICSVELSHVEKLVMLLLMPWP